MQNVNMARRPYIHFKDFQKVSHSLNTMHFYCQQIWFEYLSHFHYFTVITVRLLHLVIYTLFNQLGIILTIISILMLKV